MVAGLIWQSPPTHTAPVTVTSIIIPGVSQTKVAKLIFYIVSSIFLYMPDIRCPTCGIDTPEGKFCEHCGSSLSPVPVYSSPSPSGAATSQPPVKKRSAAATILAIIGGVFLFFIIMAVLAAFVFGMAGDTQSTKTVTATVTPVYTNSPTTVVTRVTAPAPTRYIPDSYTELIGNGNYWYYYIPLKYGDRIRTTASTDGSPIDLMVMRSTEFKKYQASISSHTGKWNAWNDLNIVNDQYDFTAPSDDTYYFVLDNTNSPTDGAYAKKAVNVAVTFNRY